jgi:serine/threonine-protein kinase
MGAVFTATHVQTGRPAAVKVLRKELTSNEELVQRFFNEAHAATRMRHPGIIEVFDFGYADDGQAFLAMELLEGVTLRQRISQQKRLPEAEAISITRAIASALAAAHGAGIIHRDLKPENIFLVESGGPKVLDFGVAKLLERDASEASRTRTGSLLGTPVYMAPEQARAAGSIDPRADLYSLGCMFYEMLSGRPPFTGNVGELLAAHMFNEPPRLVGVSPHLEALIGRLLAKEPADRPRDAQAVVDALGGVATRVRAFSDAPPIQHVEKRSAMPIIAGIATVAIAAGALALIFLRGGGDDDPPAAVAPAGPPPATAPAPMKVADPTPAPPPIAKPVKPVVTPVAPAAPPPTPPPVAIKKVHHAIEHHDTSGPVTAPGGPITSPGNGPDPTSSPVTRPGEVTPKGAPLSPTP